LKLLQLDLDAHPPPAPIVAISLAVEPAGARAIQRGLFLPLAPEPEKLELTLARIAKLVGAGNVGSPALLDSHRPEAFEMGGARFSVPARTSVRAPSGPRLALRMFRPPGPAQVEALSGRPIRLVASPLRGSVLSLAGPWRSSGHWWTPDPWARDEFDVALSDGALYRIYRNRLTRSWFIEGTYD
jgi:protein ImuB